MGGKQPIYLGRGAGHLLTLLFRKLANDPIVFKWRPLILRFIEFTAKSSVNTIKLQHRQNQSSLKNTHKNRHWMNGTYLSW